jgi:biopolymer transport protein ExbD
MKVLLLAILLITCTACTHQNTIDTPESSGTVEPINTNSTITSPVDPDRATYAIPSPDGGSR